MIFKEQNQSLVNFMDAIADITHTCEITRWQSDMLGLIQLWISNHRCYGPAVEGIIEIRLRCHGDTAEWYDRTCQEWPADNNYDAETIAHAVGKRQRWESGFQDVAEVRWNWSGSIQGHYITINQRP